jgi:hypothetical protein
MNCPVCFNGAVADETVRTSVNVGILVLMGVTSMVLAGFLGFIRSIVKRSNIELKTDVEAGLRP